MGAYIRRPCTASHTFIRHRTNGHGGACDIGALDHNRGRRWPMRAPISTIFWAIIIPIWWEIPHRAHIISARVYNDLSMPGGDDEANILHTGCVLGEDVFEVNTPVIGQLPNAYSTIVAAADNARSQCILAQRTYQLTLIYVCSQ
jgi:hypothetical protein